MSSAKFASITAGLLARKGEAAPWNQEGEKTSLAWRQSSVAAALPPIAAKPYPSGATVAAMVPPPTPREKSCSIRMSPHDFERLGIIAVKTGVSRPQLLKNALAQFLEGQAKQHGCLCLNAGIEACRSDCSR